MIRHADNIFHIEQKLAKILYVQRFRKHFVHSTFDCSIDIFIFNVAGDGDNFGLAFFVDIHLVEKLSYFLGADVPIHDRHVTVHED